MKSDVKLSSSSAGGEISVTFMILTVLFCVCLIVSNLMEIKVVDLGFMTVTAGVVVFPVSYIINDCIVEVYGFSRARMVIWLGFAMNLLTCLLLQVGLVLPVADGWEGQEAMQLIFGAVPRILAASFTAFIIGAMVNATVMSKMKAKAAVGAGNKSFSVRAVISTLWGEGADSLVFFPIAFGGVLPWSVIGELVITQVLLKTAYEVAVLPVTVRVVAMLKRHEKLDVVDLGTGFRWSWWPF